MNAPDISDSSTFLRAAVAPLWRRTGPPGGGRQPVPQAWRYQDVRPLLDLVADDVPLDVAERRVLLFVNAALAEVESTSNTLQANIQMVRPGESAPAHRHTMTAIRFGIEGSDVVTTVDGVSVTIKPGDLVLTPSMSWHEHRHVGTESVVWLDVLDRPLVEALGQVVFERTPADWVSAPTVDTDPTVSSLDATHLIGDGLTPPRTLRFPWQRTSAALDRAVSANELHATHGTTLDYRNPWTGEPITTTVAVQAHRIETTHREPWSATSRTRIVHVHSGTGHARVGDVDIAWHPSDTFIIPPGVEARIQPSEGAANLVSFDDGPALSSLALLR